MEEKKKSAGSRKAVLVATLGLACGAAVVMAVAARRPPASTGGAAIDPQAAATVETATATTTPETSAGAPTPGTASPVQAASTSTAQATKKPAVKKSASTPSAKLAFDEPVAKNAESFAAMPAAAADEAPAKPAMTAVQTASVTINGCLERDGNNFRLKDVEGEDAPKSRSWRSGFLKKGKPKIDVVDATNNRLNLTEHVGQRVSITGMLEEREMQARSVSRVATFCE